ncbi:MAG TPA: MBL fold metallo-hydrolase [Longimicrobium sp.]|nr:MBL fold metallo-hydrolase [Longimicrobium sp.]
MPPITRRDFLLRSGSCAAHLALAAAGAPAAFRALWARSPAGAVVAREPFGRLERVADGIWALISTPLNGDRTTLSNGGIVAGRHGVLAIEGFYQPQGARWLAERARELTGHWPTHVALTHYHADHVNGVAGYLIGCGDPEVRSTAPTRDLALERNQPADDARAAALRDAEILSTTEPAALDLGGRTVRLVPRRGHTASDVSIEVDDPAVVFTGDLLWNAMFPNYVDTVPSQLRDAVRDLRRPAPTLYVPGHGAVAHEAEFDRYAAMLDEVERAARHAHAQGITAAAAGAAFTLPASLGEWALFNPAFFERAFTAWYRELEG